MLDAVFELAINFLGEVVCFRLGRFYLRVLTLGHYNPTLATCKNPLLVSLFGGIATVAMVLSIAVWLHR